MVNQLSKFSPHLTEKTKPLRDLSSTKHTWTWSQPQEDAFQQTKDNLSSDQVLALYDPAYDTIVSADASLFRLGAVLKQKFFNV